MEYPSYRGAEGKPSEATTILAQAEEATEKANATRDELFALANAPKSFKEYAGGAY